MGECLISHCKNPKMWDIYLVKVNIIWLFKICDEHLFWGEGSNIKLVPPVFFLFVLQSPSLLPLFFSKFPKSYPNSLLILPCPSQARLSIPVPMQWWLAGSISSLTNPSFFLDLMVVILMRIAYHPCAVQLCKTWKSTPPNLPCAIWCN